MSRFRNQQEPDPIDNYTTAQQLGAFHRELLAEGFSPSRAEDLVEYAFRSELGFTVRIADMQGDPITLPSDDDNRASADA